MKLVPPSLLLWLLIGTALVAQPRVAYHTTLYGQLTPENSGGRFSSVWGYTAPDGREYALLAGYRGTHIIDINETPIREVAFVPGPESGWRELKTFRTYAYVVSEGGGGLQIIDLSGLPATATLVASDTRHFYSGHTISQEGDYVYVHGSDPGAGANGGTIIFDVAADPTAPNPVGIWSERYVHDATIRNDTMWAAAINDGQLDVVHLGADRRNPRFVADIRYPGAGTHNADLTKDGRYVMTTDEVGFTDKSLKIWDVSDINNIRKVADYSHNREEIIHNVHTKGDLAFIAWYTGGTRIIDLSVPTDPVEVGFYDTFPGSINTYAGNWETYPYFASGKIISSDMQTGLHVFTFDGARRGTVSGVVRDAVTGDPIPNAVVEIPELGRSVTADAQGRYRVTAASDTLEYHATGVDHFEEVGSFVLAPGESNADIRLRPIVYASVALRAIDASTETPVPAFAWRALSTIGGGATNGSAVGGTFTFRVPADGTARVRVGAWGYLPKTVELAGTATTVDIVLDRGYADDAELPLGWSLAAPSDDAINGRWERGTPVGTGFAGVFIQPGEDHTPEFGSTAFVTQITGTDPSVVGSSDVDSGRTSLTTPPMDLSTYGEPVITAWVWYSRDKFPLGDATNDTLVVSMSNDGGTTWRVIDRIYGTNNAWQQIRYPVATVLAPSTRMLFRVEASDLAAQSWVEAALDDFVVSDAAANAAPAETIEARTARIAIRPNPASGTATMSVTLVSALADARLVLFDALGRAVSTIHAGRIAAGTTGYQVDAARLAPGRYTWRLDGDGAVLATGAMTVVR